MKHSNIKKYRHSLPGVEFSQNKKYSITHLKSNLYPPIIKDNPLPLIDSHTNKKWNTSSEDLPFKLTLKDKNLIKSKPNNEESDTTISEEKKTRPVIDKISIFYEIEKSTLIIQKVFKGYMYRKKYNNTIKKKAKMLSLNGVNNSLNSSIAISEVSIEENEIEDFNDESLSDLDDI